MIPEVYNVYTTHFKPDVLFYLSISIVIYVTIWSYLEVTLRLLHNNCVFYKTSDVYLVLYIN
jgi:hypothetical protein